MAAIKSPAQILKLWKDARVKHLKTNKAKELAPQEEFLHKKVCTGLQTLAKIAKTAKGEDQAADFTQARDGVLTSMKKFRKSFEKERNAPTVTKFYRNVGSLTLTVRKLQLAELSDDETEPPETALADPEVNPDILDQEEREADERIEKEIREAAAKGEGPPAPPAPPVPKRTEPAREKLDEALARVVGSPLPEARATPETAEEKRLALNATRQEEFRSAANFHGVMDRAGAEKLLAGAPKGAWLMRYATDVNQVVVSYKDNSGKVGHAMTIHPPDTGTSMKRDDLLKNFAAWKMVPAGAKANEAPRPDKPQADSYPTLKKGWDEQFTKAAKPINEFLKKGGPEAAAIKNEVLAAKQAADRGDYGRALSLLGTIERLIKNPLQAEIAKAFNEVREQAVKDWEALKALDEPRARAVVPNFHAADKLADKGQLTQALEAIAKVRDMLKNAGEARTWEGRIDLKTYKLPSAKGNVGEGTYGEICLLTNTDPDAPALALKLPKDKAAEQELEKEAKIYQQLGDHPNVARCLGMQTVEGKKGLVMEAIPGGDMDKGMAKLRDKLAKGEIEQEEFWGVIQFSVARTLEALEFVASKGLVHTDIKPNNIMYGADGEVKLIDMGLAEAEGSAWGGVPGYGAPEAPASKGTHKSDVFGMGGITYEGGEGKRFEHNRPGELELANQSGSWDQIHGVLKAFGQGGPEEALHAEDSTHPASRQLDEATRKKEGRADPGARKKEPGRFAASTAYTEFVNWLMNPDPSKRPTAREALSHPFLKDRLVPDDRAKELIQDLHKPPPTPPPDPHRAPPPTKRV